MQSLECRFYSLTEIHKITGTNRSRDIKRLLKLWCYEYEWKDRKGVVITKTPEAPLARFTELIRRYLHVDTQINPHHFACFLTLLLEDEAFSSMPWEERSVYMAERYGINVPDRTLRNWASYLFKGEFLIKDNGERTVWYTKYSNGRKIRVRVENPDEDEEYLNYLQDRNEQVDHLRNSGISFRKAYQETVCALWEKHQRIYYYCYTLVCNAFYIEEMLEILRAAIQDGIL